MEAANQKPEDLDELKRQIKAKELDANNLQDAAGSGGSFCSTCLTLAHKRGLFWPLLYFSCVPVI